MTDELLAREHLEVLFDAGRPPQQLAREHLEVLYSVPEYHHWWDGTTYVNCELLGSYYEVVGGTPEKFIGGAYLVGWWDGTTIRPMTVG